MGGPAKRHNRRGKESSIATGIIIQARLGSTRLPGKVLVDLHGRPMLEYLLESLEHLDPPLPVILATSDDPRDAPVVEFCRRRGTTCHAGPLEDVAGRFAEVIERFDLDAFVRLSGDSPLLDHRLVGRTVELFTRTACDLATNVLVRTYPKGQSVEVVSAETFCNALGDMTDPQDREHVTRYFYRHPQRVRIADFQSGRDWGGIQLSVDRPEDFRLVERIIAAMDRPYWQYTCGQLVALRERVRNESNDQPQA